MLNSIDGASLRRFIINGANELNKNSEHVNAMNVFPVPDGDTGTNMTMTAISAAKAAQSTESDDICDVAKAAANGALRGARGNSGVILSQIFRGFSKAVAGKKSIDGSELTLALASAKEEAYKAVMKPKEGTLLTIIRALSEAALKSGEEEEDIAQILHKSLEYAEDMLMKTPDMLPELKAAGVVDSGGQGLVYIIKGGYENIGKESEILTAGTSFEAKSAAASAKADIKYGYCTEFIVTGEGADGRLGDELRPYLDTMGDSIVFVRDTGLIKVHVHTNHPGEVIERALKIGSLESVKIENMRLQHTSLIEKEVEEIKAEETDYGFVVIANGNGSEEMFKEYGADVVLFGGQTMNSSTEDILNAIDKVNAKTVFVLPNNKNIILAANQASEMTKGKKVVVIPSKSIPQGAAAMLAYMPELSASENTDAMKEAMEAVVTGEVTSAVRDTTVNDIDIKKGEYIAICDDSIVASREDITECAKALIDKMLEDRDDLFTLTVYYGEDASEEKAAELAEYAEDEYDVDTELRNGGQAVYAYIFGAE